MKRSIILGFIITVFLSTIASAHEFPNRLWTIDNKFLSALENNNYTDIINYGTQELEILKNELQDEHTQIMRAARTEQVCIAYEKLKDYSNAAYYYNEYAQRAAEVGWDDAVKIAKAKVLQYTPVIDLYARTQTTQKYYGAKNEYEKGVYFGTNVDGGTRQSGKLSQESALLLYIEYGADFNAWIKEYLEEAKNKHIPIEIALNVPGQGGQIPQIVNDTSYAQKIAQIIAEYPTVPVFMRFAAEMNIWDTQANPEEFKAAFRKVSDIMHRTCPNVAVVWAVGNVSPWNVDMDDFYPGDKYVDWVGVHVYSTRHFMGKVWSEEESFNELVFFGGDGADPVLAMREVIDKYGDRKPIMLSESGVSHYVRNNLNHDETQWADVYLQKQYKYIPMVYPQVKMMMYFDKEMKNEINDYTLSNNSVMQNEYLHLVEDSSYIHKDNKDEATSFAKLSDTMVLKKGKNTLYGYAHVYGNDTPTMSLYVDGSWVTSTNEVGYKRVLDLSNYSLGEHTLKAVIEGVVEKEYKFTLVDEVNLLINNKSILSDVPPIIENGRTLVPIRVIAENLGTKVDWNGAEKKVTLTRGGKVITMQLGKNEAYVNGEVVYLDVAAKTIADRTIVPVRFIAEQFDVDVKWEQQTSTVLVNEK